MEKIELQAETREETGRKVRYVAKKRIPAVVYGHGFETKNIWVDQTSFNRAFDNAGTSTIITLSVDSDKSFGTLVHDFQANPITNDIMHVDFFHVRMDEKVETNIPLVITGESAAIKNLGGVLNSLESLSIRALPGDLVHEIIVDISAIATFDDRITIADLNISDALEVLTDLDTPVATVSAPRIQKEDEEVSGEDAVEGEAAVADGASAEGGKEGEKS
jgi:large subunit ribosomal protein L25